MLSRGLREGLAQPLKPTDDRCIGILRFEGGRANAAVHYDRENPDQLSASEISESVTDCCFVRDRRGSSTTVNARLDERLEGYAARQVVLAYCGVPVMDAEGVLIGTLCHDDLVPGDPDQVDLELLIQVASTAAQRGRVLLTFTTRSAAP